MVCTRTDKADDETTSSTHVSVWDSMLPGQAVVVCSGDTQWDRIYVDMKLPYDVDSSVGRWLQDSEGDMGSTGDTINPIFGSYRMDGFRAIRHGAISTEQLS